MAGAERDRNSTFYARRVLHEALDAARTQIEALCASEDYRRDGRRPCDFVPDFGTDDEGIQRSVDYTDPLTQAFYAWRYTSGYCYEHACAYRDILARNIPRKLYNVISIGCGTGVDYWALDYAMRRDEEWDRAQTAINYVGIDLIDWSGSAFRLLKGDVAAGSRYVYGQDAIEYLCEGEGRHLLPDADVIMMPKSILEIDAESLERLAETMSRRWGGWMYLVICPPQDTAGADRAWAAGGEVTNRMIWQPGVEEHVEAFVSRLRRYFDVHPAIPGTPENTAIVTLDDTFRVSEACHERWERGFHELCPHWDECDRRTSTPYIEGGLECRAMDHTPIVRAKYVCYEIYELVRTTEVEGLSG